MRSLARTSRVTWALVLVLIAGVALVGGAPDASAAEDDQPVRVMFLGDSITGSPGCWRADVWVALASELRGLDVDAVGPRTADECGGVQNDAGAVWDADNAGFPNENTSAIFVRIARDGLLEEHDPEVIAMLLGTNDFWGGQDAEFVLDQYEVLLDQMRAHRPTVALVVGTVPPMAESSCPTCQDQIDLLNSALPHWAAEMSTDLSPVTIALLHEDFDVETDTYDGVHPNDEGNAVLATAWDAPVAAAVETAPERRNVAPPEPDPTPEATETAEASADPTPSTSASATGEDGIEGEATTVGPSVWMWVLLALLVAGGAALAVRRSKGTTA